MAAPLAAQPLDPLQVADAVVQDAGWRLASGNAPYCRETMPSVGLLLQDAGNYEDPAAAQAALGLSHDIAVEAAAAGSPAQAAGLAANQAVVSLDGRDLTALPAIRAGDWRRLAGLHDAIDAALARDGKVMLAIGGEQRREVTLTGVPACAARFELATSRSGARASGRRVIVTRAIYDQVGGDPRKIAAIMAHELAHVVLGHRNLKQLPVKQREEQADRLSVWLLQNAGYDPAAAVRLQLTWGQANDRGILSSPDHNRWKKRAAQMAAEITAMRSAMAADPGGTADWRRDFRRIP